MRILLLAPLLIGSFAQAQKAVPNFQPVTQQMLENPSPDDWLLYSRTYDAQRYSPLKQINKQNIGQLRMVWSRGMGQGNTEGIPLVHNGVMYVIAPGAVIQALDASNGELIWQYKRDVPANIAGQARSKSLAIFGDVIAWTAPDSTVVGLDARTGEKRWESKTDSRGHVSGAIAIDGKIISGGACYGSRPSCYIAAHDSTTGKELWRFYTPAGPDDEHGDTWAGAPVDKRSASTWGLPGTYDPVRKMLYWGVANPTPNTRMVRHAGNINAVPRSSPANLYSNSTLSLDANTGKLNWYYQHLPGDDWDEDYTHERTLLRTPISPDPKFVKWINPDVKKGEQRDIAVMVGEGGGIFALDRGSGQFLWASPFPFDVPNFLISNIDVKTGKTYINWDLVFKSPGEHHVICFFNTRSYWPTAYSPATNSLYVPYIDNCLDMTSAGPQGPERRRGILRPGGNPDEMSGIAKINMSTGETLRFALGHTAATGAVLATAGDLIFHGDLNRRFKAYDAATGKQLWETVLGGPISVSTITYGANGKQYVSVICGDNLAVNGLAREAGIDPPKGHNTIYTFALP